MQSLAFQNSNILENLYTDGVMTYIQTPTIYNMPHQFQSITTYCNGCIPSWNPCYNDPSNRLAYNSDFLFELIFYKNLILAIPLYISSNSTTTGAKFESAIAHLKSYCHKLTSAEDGFDTNLATLLDYKFIFYSPNTIPGHYNIFKTKHTIIKTDLYTPMFQSVPSALNNTPIANISSNHIYENIIHGNTPSNTPSTSIMSNNPLYVPFQTTHVPISSLNTNSMITN